MGVLSHSITLLGHDRNEINTSAQAAEAQGFATMPINSRLGVDKNAPRSITASVLNPWFNSLCLLPASVRPGCSRADGGCGESPDRAPPCPGWVIPRRGPGRVVWGRRVGGFGLFTEADVFDWEGEFVLDGDEHAAFAGAVELGDDQTGKSNGYVNFAGLVEGVQAGDGVEHEQTSRGAPSTLLAITRWTFCSSCMRLCLVWRRPAVSMKR